MAKNKNNNKQTFWIVLALVIAVLLFGGFLSKEEITVEARDDIKCEKEGYKCIPKGECSKKNMGDVDYCFEGGAEGYCCFSETCQGKACCGDDSVWKDGKCGGGDCEDDGKKDDGKKDDGKKDDGKKDDGKKDDGEKGGGANSRMDFLY
jgi:hypothetical protein